MTIHPFIILERPTGHKVLFRQPPWGAARPPDPRRALGIKDKPSGALPGHTEKGQLSRSSGSDFITELETDENKRFRSTSNPWISVDFTFVKFPLCNAVVNLG